jgi:hypothetical protein
MISIFGAKLKVLQTITAWIYDDVFVSACCITATIRAKSSVANTA